MQHMKFFHITQGKICILVIYSKVVRPHSVLKTKELVRRVISQFQLSKSKQTADN